MSFDRSEHRKKRLKLLLIFGSASAALAVAAVIFGWAWGPLAANWTLPPQPVAEDAEAPKSVDKRWAALRMPVATISGPLSKNQAPTETPVDETMVMADLGSSFAAMEPSAGQGDPSVGDPNPFFFGMGPSGYNPGGTGRTWPGTINPNGSGQPGPGFSNYSPPGGGTGPGGGGTGPGTDPCKASNAASNPKCSTGPGGPGGPGGPNGPDTGDNGGCVTWNSNVSGSNQNLNGEGECEDDTAGNNENDNGGDNESCVGWNSSISGPGSTVNNGTNCEQQNTENENENDGDNNGGTGGSCVSSTSTVGGVTTTTYSEGCQMPPPSPPVGNICLSDEGCGANGPGPGQVVTVPEPGSMALLLSGLAGLLALRRRR